jgi:hypothetical protein
MLTKGSSSKSWFMTVAGLVTGAVGIGVLWASGVEFPFAIPPAIVILLATAVLVALASRRWVPAVGAFVGFSSPWLSDQPHQDSELCRPARNECASRHLDSGGRCAHRAGRRCARHPGELSQARPGQVMNESLDGSLGTRQAVRASLARRADPPLNVLLAVDLLLFAGGALAHSGLPIPLGFDTWGNRCWFRRPLSRVSARLAC